MALHNTVLQKLLLNRTNLLAFMTMLQRWHTTFTFLLLIAIFFDLMLCLVRAAPDGTFQLPLRAHLRRFHFLSSSLQSHNVLCINTKLVAFRNHYNCCLDGSAAAANLLGDFYILRLDVTWHGWLLLCCSLAAAVARLNCLGIVVSAPNCGLLIIEEWLRERCSHTVRRAARMHVLLLLLNL